VVAELHDSRRHLAQIRDAYGAAGCTQLLALEDKEVEKALGASQLVVFRRLLRDEGEFPPPLAARIARTAQRGAERAQSRLRREMVLRERQIDDLLAFSGRRD
jgi:hypothetical protein